MTAIIPNTGGNDGGNRDSGSAQVGAISLEAPGLHGGTASRHLRRRVIKIKHRGRQRGNLLTTEGLIFFFLIIIIVLIQTGGMSSGSKLVIVLTGDFLFRCILSQTETATGETAAILILETVKNH